LRIFHADKNERENEINKRRFYLNGHAKKIKDWDSTSRKKAQKREDLAVFACCFDDHLGIH